MFLPIRLIATDFDGTLHADFEHPPVPADLQSMIGQLQAFGAFWVINTGRDLSSLVETLSQACLAIRPDFVVVVEREIYCRLGSQYVGLAQWNRGCCLAHEELFARIQPDLPRLAGWVHSHYRAKVYEDAYSPFCLLADNNDDADAIHEYLNTFCQSAANLVVVRNGVYARFSHQTYNKGTALAEIARRLGIGREHILVAGDDFNDLPMLSRHYARWLVAPFNAIQEVKETVLRQRGYVSHQPFGSGVARGLEFALEATAFLRHLKLKADAPHIRLTN